MERTYVKKGASIGSGARSCRNVTIGENAIVGAGSVVTKDVPPEQYRCRKSSKSPSIHRPEIGGYKVSSSNTVFLFLI